MFRDHVQYSFFEYYILVCLPFSFGLAGQIYFIFTIEILAIVKKWFTYKFFKNFFPKITE